VELEEVIELLPELKLPDPVNESEVPEEELQRRKRKKGKFTGR
jgi:hypothetical protein